MSDNKYLYSVTRIRALETKLIEKSKLERMIEAKDGEEIFKILSETEYGILISELSDASDYETMLTKELVRTYSLINQISPAPELTNIFLYKYDIHNLKVLLKSSFLGEENDYLLMDIGTIPINKLKEYVKEKDYTELNPIIRNSIENINNSFSYKADPQLIDLVLDKSLFELMYKTAYESKSTFLVDYIKSLIDLTNIKSFIRIKDIGLGRDYLKKVIIDSGKLDKGFFNEMFDEPTEMLIEKLAFSDYHKVIEEGISSYMKTKRLTKFEKLSDDYVFEIAKRGKYIAFGIEPIIGYIMAKENEIKAIRMIMVGKMNEIPNEVIRERLRDVYV